MDDQSLTGAGWARPVSLLALGLLAGLGIGWVVWHDRAAAGSGATAASTLPGAASGTQVEGVDVSRDPAMGPETAPVTIVEFSDFDCQFCARFATETAPLLRRQYGDRVRWIFVNYPLQSIHPRAYDAALAGECAHEQEKFWSWYDALFSGRFQSTDAGLADAAAAIGLDVSRYERCVTAADHAGEVADDIKEGQKFYILGTPTFFVNGQRLEGAQPPEAFAAVIDSILAGS
ncbi:MAG: DsbA family protein [Gemmatimonadota bacterium]